MTVHDNIHEMFQLTPPPHQLYLGRAFKSTQHPEHNSIMCIYATNLGDRDEIEFGCLATEHQVI